VGGVASPGWRRRPTSVHGAWPQRASKIDPYKEHLHGQWDFGVPDAARLAGEVTALGCTGSGQTVAAACATSASCPAHPKLT
jgi:hypothetical protein